MHTVVITAPSSKSLSHRALLAAALAGGRSRLSGVLESEDTRRTREALEALGAAFTLEAPGRYAVQGLGGVVRALGAGAAAETPVLDINVGESGTTCRLLTAILAAGQGRFHVHGEGRMYNRPVSELADALTSLGARFAFSGKPGCPPFTLEANGLAGPEAEAGLPAVSISAEESSQYISGLLLAAPLGRGLAIRLGGGRAVSWPYVGLTLAVMEDFGLNFSVQATRDPSYRPQLVDWQNVDWRGLREAEPGRLRFLVPQGGYQARDYQVEGDWSGASYFLAAGAIGPKSVRVEGLKVRSLQGDAAMLSILARMGARMETSETGITVFPSALQGITVDMGQCPDLAPTVAALAAHAEGETRIINAAHLKIKESDRLAAPAMELRRAGCEVAVLDDGLVIRPPLGGPRPPVDGSLFRAHNDHRMAMSVSLLGLPGLRGKGFAVRLDDPACVAKSFPHFWELWNEVRA